jgi:Uma2 family endonuclease
MTTAITKSVFTPEDLLTLPDAVNYELVDGNLVERAMGSKSSAIGAAVTAILVAFVRPRQLGHLFNSECGYQCYPDNPTKVRKPDVSFIKSGRLPGEQLPEGHVRITPDLVVEVLSPGDLAYEIDAKVQEYLIAGVKLVWVVSPNTRTVRIHRPKTAPHGPIAVLSDSDTITGDDVLPGFECAVAEFFEV